MPVRAGRGSNPAPSAGRGPIAEAQRADEPTALAGGLDDRADHQGRDRLAEAAGHAQRDELVRRVAGQGLADPRMGRPGIGDDDLEPPGFGAGALHHHAGRAPVQRLAHEGVPVVPRPRSADRDEHLARVQPAMIVGAAGDFPVRAPHELGLGEQPPQAHRRNPLLG